MNDHELVQAAAKAAGMLGEWLGGIGWLEYPGASRLWRPLTDDGDALRLAVKLGLTIEHVSAPNHPFPLAVEVWHRSQAGNSVLIDHADDPYAATRRAIVRAAAAISQSNDRSES